MIKIVHHSDSDGFAAAYAAWKKLGRDGVEYLPADYDDKLPDFTGMDVYFLDFTPHMEDLIRIKDQVKSIVVLDHHKTAKHPEFDFCHYEDSKSGCMMAWEWFHPGVHVPDIISYVQDFDLGTDELPFTKEVNAALDSYERKFEVWDKLFNLPLDILVQEGLVVMRYCDKICRMLKKNTHFATVDPWFKEPIPVVNTPVLIAEVGKRWIKHYPACIVWFERKGQLIISLRSRPESDIDCAEIAKQYGGGGHKNAAGFFLPMNGEPDNLMEVFKRGSETN